MITGGRRAIAPLLSLVALLCAGAPAWTTPDDCLVCHGEFSALSVLNDSVHAGLDCFDCHAGLDAESLPHPAESTGVDCAACHGDVSVSHRFHARDPEGGPAYGIDCIDCHGAHDISSPAPIDPPTGHPGRSAFCAACHDKVVEEFLTSEHGRVLAEGIAGAPDCVTCHVRPITVAREERNGADLKFSQEQTCLSCHLDDPEVRARMTPSAGFIAAYERSVHGAALLAGNAAAAGCIDCHGSHEMKHGYDPRSRVSKVHIPETCGACHADIAQEYALSVHAAAVRGGNHDAPVCTDCHGEHDIVAPHDPASRVAPANVSERVCSPCHSSIRLSEKYGIASDRFATYSDSYHGLAMRGGVIEVANCASCHGAHDIRPSSDPASSVHKDNLPETCGRCHPGAGARFGVGAVHVMATEPGSGILSIVASFYIGLIVVVIGGMSLHNILDFVRRSRRRLRLRHEGREATAPGGDVRLYLRMTLSERLQHATLVISFTLLVVTGFMLRYPEAWWVQALSRISGSLFDLRSLLHRIAGIVMIAVSLYHVAHVALTARGRQFLRDILPCRQDLAEAGRMILYNLGWDSGRPRFGRFSYIEKSEYWALVWGTIIMALTGIVLWFEETFIGLLTKIGWDVARTIHFFEAWLAFLAILVWHIYYVVVNPDVYPMNTAWLTGHVTEEEMREEHPRELESHGGAAPRAR